MRFFICFNLLILIVIIGLYSLERFAYNDNYVLAILSGFGMMNLMIILGNEALK